ncbi:unannotated protein [freshwater metagenome]|uniref:Unannotated protein n=1 Tax=freshwater metagenome TaxID=449393 RepID=A0A6J6IJ31_9ZZZZ|nr:hypothetical protein [Actinomycetota bacterium]
MSVEFLVAVGFGVGVAGLLAQSFSVPQLELAVRVQTPTLVLSKPVHKYWAVNFKQFQKLVVRSSNKRGIERALLELPEIIDLLVVCLRAGDGIYRSFATVVPRCEGELATELSSVLHAVEYGASFGEEIHKASAALPHPLLAEFTNKVSLALERGTPLAQMLSEQGQSARAEVRNRLLRQAGKNETRMLIPLVFLILPITVLFAIYPSLELLNFGFI